MPVSSATAASTDDKDDDKKRRGRCDAGGGLTTRQRRDAACDVARSSKFNRARARRLFAGLTPLLRRIAEEEGYARATHAARDGDDGSPDVEDEDEAMASRDSKEEKEEEEQRSQEVLFLRCCAFLVEAYLDGLLMRRNGSATTTRPIPIVDEAFEVAELLHGSLFPLHSCAIKEAPQTASAVFSMCERWWHGNFEDREQLVTQLIPLLLVKSLDDSATKADVRRLHSVRDAIDLLDFDDESISTLRTHLLRTANSPPFLRCAEGRRFVAHLFVADGSGRLAADLHLAIRAQVAGARRGVLNAYAEIYYAAWRSADAYAQQEEEEEEDAGGGEEPGSEGTTGNGTATIRASIEENALQDLAYQAIHAAVPSTAKAARAVLEKFHANKKSPRVEAALHRTYGPLLWRALSSANSIVRRRASSVLSDTFPLRDPDAGEEGTRECVRRSAEALVKLAEDDVPANRAAGSAAAARIARDFWTAIPSADLRTLLDRIIARHASDASSSAVRAAAVNAISTMLEEERTHGALRPLLPSLGNLIHDESERVRLAVVNMLLRVKGIRGMKYYHVVPAGHLLARLAEEGRGRNDPRGPVAAGLSDLLGNSFFPTGSKKTMADIVNRTLRLLGDNPGAAVTFYKNASSQLSVNSIARLIAALIKCLCFFVVEEKKKNEEDVGDLSLVFSTEDRAIEYRGGDDNGDGPSNTALMATIAESVSILWDSIEPQLKDSQNQDAEEMLAEVFSGNVLTEVYRHFETEFEKDRDPEDGNDGQADELLDCHRACVAILNCAGKLDESRIEGMRSVVVDELSKASDAPGRARRRTKANLSPNVALLCAWGMTEDVAACLASSVAEYFEGDVAEEGASAGRVRKSGASRKRKQREKQRKTTGGARLPRLDIDVCLGILGHILKGTYPASVLARESILKSETAFDSIATALQTAQSAAERMINPRTVEDTELSPAMIKHIGISIECYGRLLVHKEATKGEIPMSLSPGAKALSCWVTDTIVPALSKLARRDDDGDDNPLDNLDISIISAASPSLDRNSSSPIGGNLGDASFLSTRGSLNIFEDKSKFVSTRAAATTAMSSVLCVFAEWQSVRFIGDSFLSTQFSEWCKLLERADVVVRKALLQLFFHIAITSLKNEGDAAMLKEMLSSMKKAEPCLAEAETISYAMAIVTSIRDQQTLKAAISSIVDLTCTIMMEDEGECDMDPPSLDIVGTCMRKVIAIVLGEKQSSLILAQYLIDEPKKSSAREYLLKELKIHSPKTEALNKVLCKWSAEIGDKENQNLNDSEYIAA